MDLASSRKNTEISKLFDDISPNYDFLNHFLSFNIDKRWRKKVIHLLKSENNVSSILDVATGTGDLAIEAFKQIPYVKIVGMDVSSKMMEIAAEKVAKLNFSDRFEFVNSPAESIPYPENSFDAIMVAFGVRNFENLEQGIREMKRVLKSTGRIYILEFSKPHGFMKPFYFFYFRFVLPVLGRLISKHKSAYRYLYESVKNFPDSSDFVNDLVQLGIINVRKIRLHGGIATIYTGSKQ
jgi:demethylmenaquinone methyltransferase/2-methoxy-6-polyprenyl-1,4-benzoquinol methylase